MKLSQMEEQENNNSKIFEIDNGSHHTSFSKFTGSISVISPFMKRKPSTNTAPYLKTRKSIFRYRKSFLNANPHFEDDSCSLDRSNQDEFAEHSSIENNYVLTQQMQQGMYAKRSNKESKLQELNLKKNNSDITTSKDQNDSNILLYN